AGRRQLLECVRAAALWMGRPRHRFRTANWVHRWGRHPRIQSGPSPRTPRRWRTGSTLNVQSWTLDVERFRPGSLFTPFAQQRRRRRIGPSPGGLITEHEIGRLDAVLVLFERDEER